MVVSCTWVFYPYIRGVFTPHIRGFGIDVPKAGCVLSFRETDYNCFLFSRRQVGKKFLFIIDITKIISMYTHIENDIHIYLIVQVQLQISVFYETPRMIVYGREPLSFKTRFLTIPNQFKHDGPLFVPFIPSLLYSPFTRLRVKSSERSSRCNNMSKWDDHFSQLN